MLSYLSRHPDKKFKRSTLAKEIAKTYGFKKRTVTTTISKVTVRDCDDDDSSWYLGKGLLIRVGEGRAAPVKPVGNIVELYNEKVLLGIILHKE
jgi:hypothetical protein